MTAVWNRSRPATPPAPKPPERSEAITLLATLQREARFVDFIQESLAAYSDAQIGAAVRDVHRDCAAVLKRLFELRPAVRDDAGAGRHIHRHGQAGDVVAGQSSVIRSAAHPRLRSSVGAGGAGPPRAP